MSKVVLKNLPSTIADTEINFTSNSLSSVNKELLVETIEFLEDFLYISNRENETIDYVEKKDVLDLISKYK